MAVDSVKTPTHDTIVDEVSQQLTVDPWNEIPTIDDVTVDDFLTSQFDADMFKAALLFCGLPTNWNRMFQQRTRIDKETGKPKLDKKGNQIIDLGSCRSVSRACIKDNAAVWAQINPPFEGTAIWTSKDGKHSGPKKARNDEIQFIRNVTLDAEYPSSPHMAHGVGRKLADHLVRLGIIEPNHPIDDTGAGFHLVLPIVQIEIPAGSPPEISTLWNCAVARVVKTHILPEFDRLCQEAGIEMDLEAFDISRILSFPGTWRPTNPKKEDAPFLKKGYLRRWLEPYVDGNYPVRHENAKLTQLIQEAFVELQSEHKETVKRGGEYLKTHPDVKPNNLPPDMTDDALITWIMGWENGAEFTELYYGGWCGHNSASSADLACCNFFAAATGKDPVRMDALFRQSGLMRDKWDRKARTGETYGEGTIQRAIEGCTFEYDPMH